jgi:FKBP-type peptidyl-prolyl cis-trans isomerase 2
MIDEGSRVQFHFTLFVDDEETQSSRGGDPVDYVHGQGQLIEGLEGGLAGLAEGESKSVVLPPAEAYGEHNPDFVNPYPRDAFADLDGLEAGDVVRGTAGEQPFQATVVEMGDEHVVLDMNHPLAGKTLRFEVEVVSVS